MKTVKVKLIRYYHGCKSQNIVIAMPDDVDPIDLDVECDGFQDYYLDREWEIGSWGDYSEPQVESAELTDETPDITIGCDDDGNLYVKEDDQ